MDICSERRGVGAMNASTHTWDTEHTYKYVDAYLVTASTWVLPNLIILLELLAQSMRIR